MSLVEKMKKETIKQIHQKVYTVGFAEMHGN